MKLLKTSLLALAISFSIPYVYAAASSEVSDTNPASSLKQFAQMGKTIFKDHAEDLKSMWTHGVIDSRFKDQIRVLAPLTSKSILNQLKTEYQAKFTTMAQNVEALFSSAYGERHTCELTDEERAFAPLGLATASLALDDSDAHFRGPLFNESLKSIFDHLTGSGSIKIISFTNETPEDLSPDQDPSDLALKERMKHVKTISELQYLFLLQTPLTETLRPWDVATASGRWSFLRLGNLAYQSQENDLFHKPMRDRFKKMISDSSSQKDQIAYDTMGTSYKDLESNEEKFEHFFIKELGSYLNAALQKYFFVKGKEETTYEQGIETVRSIKTFAYKTVADLVVRLYPGLSAEEYGKKVSAIAQRDWVLSEMKNLFDQDGRPQPNPLWGEFVFGYDKAREYKLIPQQES